MKKNLQKKKTGKSQKSDKKAKSLKPVKQAPVKEKVVVAPPKDATKAAIPPPGRVVLNPELRIKFRCPMGLSKTRLRFFVLDTDNLVPSYGVARELLRAVRFSSRDYCGLYREERTGKYNLLVLEEALLRDKDIPEEEQVADVLV
ncbi:hypothetical protein EDEG_00718 [Edhazardia aedis USNM 41457]|uniref:Uncharacterized protein n=1 Tax=Edhazardia aedis (strain USNM 41457) TaxID=1003232 RepID=J9DBT4_EDHAE|nr:hypothetical protein EDEG_00718 [Edhazardia aedis USNM 41457]|eukprot:EJW05186.1 hypothetical protein EDEG_00718 [Edhazardia aedis USNM 41457]